MPKVLVVDDWINLLNYERTIRLIVDLEFARHPEEVLIKLKSRPGQYNIVVLNASYHHLARFVPRMKELFSGSIVALCDPEEDVYRERALKAGCHWCVPYRELYGQLVSLVTN